MVRHRRRDGCSGDRGLGCRCAGSADTRDGAALRRTRRSSRGPRTGADAATGYDLQRADGACPGASFATVGVDERPESSRRADTPPKTGPTATAWSGTISTPMSRRRAPTRRRSSSTRLRQHVPTISRPAAGVHGARASHGHRERRPDPGVRVSTSLTISVVRRSHHADGRAPPTATAQWAPGTASTRSDAVAVDRCGQHVRRRRSR